MDTTSKISNVDSTTKKQAPPQKLSPGARTQIPSTEQSEERELIVGFDLGSSCSKIVIQDVDARLAYAVSFHELACPDYPNLLPTSITLNKSGIFKLNAGPGAVDRLKTQCLSRPDHALFRLSTGENVTTEEALTAYIALALREARAWFLEAQETIYERINLLWGLNLGMPARDFNNKKLVSLQKRIAMAAWAASTLPGAVSVQSAKACLIKARDRLDGDGHLTQSTENPDTWLHADLVCPVPEVIAEVKGYVDSPLKREGLHLLVDVGASTLDVAMFNVLESEGEHTYPILSAEIKQLGAHMLLLSRLKGFTELVNSQLRDRMSHLDPTESVPEIEDLSIELDVEEIQRIESPFQDKVGQFIAQIVSETKKRRDPGSYQWRKGVPVFVCGGGASVPIYRKALDRVDSDLATVADFEYINLPKPDGLNAPDISTQDYSRLAVAYGLSFREPDIGKIVPPGGIPDLRRTLTTPTEDRYVSKDMV